MGISLQSAAPMIDRRLADAAFGDTDAYYDLGVAWSTGTGGAGTDLIAAHMWFNLAAQAGDERGKECRAEIADEMTAREIVEAQKRARAWLSTHMRRAA